MKISAVFFASLLILALPAPGQAQDISPAKKSAPSSSIDSQTEEKSTKVKIPHGIGADTYKKSFIYGINGNECPPGSQEIIVPESVEAAEKGFIYCMYTRSALSVKRSEYKECPKGTMAYKTEKKPHPDYFFCVFK